MDDVVHATSEREGKDGKYEQRERNTQIDELEEKIKKTEDNKKNKQNKIRRRRVCGEESLSLATRRTWKEKRKKCQSGLPRGGWYPVFKVSTAWTDRPPPSTAAQLHSGYVLFNSILRIVNSARRPYLTDPLSRPTTHTRKRRQGLAGPLSPFQQLHRPPGGPNS